MSLRTSFLGAACGLALVSLSGPASAATNFDGVLDGGYSNYDFNHGGGSVSDWHINGGGMFGLDPEWAAQINAGYNHSNGSGTSANAWNVDGAAFWRGGEGRIGAAVGYTDINTAGPDVNATHYGLFGDWYATRSISLGVKGGAFNGSHGIKGDYAGAQIIGYVMPDFALSGSYDYTHVDHATNENDFTAQGEWLFSHSVPLSLYGGYTRAQFSHGVSANVWFVGLRFYCDPVDGTLADRQRNGAEIYGTHFGPAALRF